MVLSDYLTDTSALLRDTNYQFTSQAQMTRWINQARSQVAKVTGCLRFLVAGQSPFGGAAQPGSMIPGGFQPGSIPGNFPSTNNIAPATTLNSFSTIPGVEMYPFAFAQPYLQAQYQGVKAVIDVINVAVSWGGIRPTLAWMPWEDLQAYARSYNVGVTSYPFCWATNGDGENAQLWLFPIPTQQNPASGEMEWDCFCVPTDLISDNDYDAIPSGFQGAVKYYAAKLCYLASQRQGIADYYQGLFEQHLGVDRTATNRGKVPNYYDNGVG